MAGKQASTGKKPQAQGVGESKRHGGTTPREDALDWSTLTVNGQPIPKNLWDKMPYKLTDQGMGPVVVKTVDEIIAGRARQLDETEKASMEIQDAMMGGKPVPKEAARKVSRAARMAGAPLGNGGDDVGAFAEGLKTDRLALNQDPLRTMMDEHTPEGHSGLWMSEAQCRTMGMHRGVMKYQEVLVNGKRVEVGGMFLASVPLETMQQANAYQKRLNEEMRTRGEDSVREASDRLISAADVDRTARRRGMEDADIGLADDDPDVAFADMVEASAGPA